MMKAKSSVHQDGAVRAFGEDQRQKWVMVGCWGVCIGFALLEVWSGRQFTNHDGVVYLDMSDALLRHNYHLLINPLWSPLYPFLIGVATWLVRPSAYWELPIVHAVNFVIFLGMLGSFEFLLRQVICVLGRGDGWQDTDSTVPLPNWIWQLLGYSLFAWTTFVLISGLRMVTPDQCVAMFVYLDAGLLLKLRTEAKKSQTFLLLGLTLGLGYLAKAILFPLAFVFMVAAFFVVGEWRKAVLPLIMTFFLFSAISAPLFVGISRMVGRPSYSESGNLNYAWHVNGKKTTLTFYSASPPPYLKHPMNLLHKRPDVFSFRESLVSTYPPYFDAQHWNAGVRPAFNLLEQLRVIGSNLAVFCVIPLVSMWVLIGGGLTLFFMNPNVPQRFQHIVKSWPLLIPGAAATCLYLAVWVEPRYVAPFVLLVFLGLFPGILLQKSEDVTKRIAFVTSVVAAFVIVLTALFIVHRAALPVLRDYGGAHYQLAETLNREGMRPGEAVAIIGYGGDEMMWARLARLRIVAQIPSDDAEEFWRADPQVKAEVFESIARTGAKAVVTEETPSSGGVADWQRVGNTQYYVHFLTPQGGEQFTMH